MSSALTNLKAIAEKYKWRLGQAFVSVYMKDNWVEMYYEENDYKALMMIYQWLYRHHYQTLDQLPILRDFN